MVEKLEKLGIVYVFVSCNVIFVLENSEIVWNVIFLIIKDYIVDLKFYFKDIIV